MAEVSPSTSIARAEAAAVVHEVLATWLAGNGAPNVTCVYDINSGPCCDFAEEVADLLQTRHPGAEIHVEDYEDYLRSEGLTADGIHYYVRVGDWYFDASRPDGEPSPDYLPTCREIRRFASHIDDDFEPQDDFDDDVGRHGLGSP